LGTWTHAGEGERERERRGTAEGIILRGFGHVGAGQSVLVLVALLEVEHVLDVVDG
jgi:hypothetical protein